MRTGWPVKGEPQKREKQGGKREGKAPPRIQPPRWGGVCLGAKKDFNQTHERKAEKKGRKKEEVAKTGVLLWKCCEAGGVIPLEEGIQGKGRGTVVGPSKKSPVMKRWRVGLRTGVPAPGKGKGWLGGGNKQVFNCPPRANPISRVRGVPRKLGRNANSKALGLIERGGVNP